MNNQPSASKKLTIAESAAVTQAFWMGDHIGGHVIVPAAWTAANIGFKICDSETGTFVIAKTEAGVPIQISAVLTSQSDSFKIPNELFPVSWVKLWSKSTTAATETDVNQAAARSLTVILK